MRKVRTIFALLGVVTTNVAGLTTDGASLRDARAWSANGGVPLGDIHAGFCADLEAKLQEDGTAPEGGLSSCTIQHFECVRTCRAGTDGPCLLGSSWGLKDFPVANKPENKLGCSYQQPGMWDFFLIENGWPLSYPDASEMTIASGMTGYDDCEVAPEGTNGYVDGMEGSCVEAFIGMSRDAGTRIQFEPTCNGRPDPLSCTAFNSTFCDLPDKEVVDIVTKLCPIMCDSCDWTTSTDTTSTTTTSITSSSTTTSRTTTTTTLTTTTDTTTTGTETTITESSTTASTTTKTTTSETATTTSQTTTTPENCNGKYDPMWCMIPGPEKCRDPEIGLEIREACRLMCDSCDDTTLSTTTTSTTATGTTATGTTTSATTTTTITVQMLKLTVNFTDSDFASFEDRDFQTKLSAAIKDFIVDNSDLLMVEIASIDFDPPMSFDAMLMPNLLQGDVAAALAKLTATLPFAFPELGLVEHSFVVTSIEQGTTTWVAPMCNGLPDPVNCHEEKAAYCTNSEVGDRMQERCPVMCGTCILTTTTTTTATTTTSTGTTSTSTTSSSTTTVTATSTTVSTTTATSSTTTTGTETRTSTTTTITGTSTTITTTTIPTCNGTPDPESCAEFFTCDSQIYGDKLMTQCPVLCSSCTSTTVTGTSTTVTTTTATTVTETTKTTTTPSCNGLPDPDLCKAQKSELCYNSITSAQLQLSCPVLCGSCIPTSSTTTTTTVSATSTTTASSTTTTTVTTSTTSTSTTVTTTSTPTCNGQPDPEDCETLIPASDCTNPFVGDAVLLSCPVMCNSCPTTTATSTTTTTTTTSATATTTTTTATTTTATTATATSVTATKTTTTGTTTTTAICNGKPDPAGCANEDSKFCRNEITELPLAAQCPVLCDACITTSSTTSTITTSTTTTPSCNGEVDPDECSKFNLGQCTDSIYGAELVKECPLLCNTCIQTTFTSTTTTTTVTSATSTTSTTTSSTSTATSVTETSTTPPNCNGNLDPPECIDFIRDDCRNAIIGHEVRAGCPVKCNSCITTTFTTTTTTTTVSSTTGTTTTTTTTTGTTTSATGTTTTGTSTTASTTTTTYTTTTRTSTTKTTTTRSTTTTTKTSTTETETSTTTDTSTTKTSTTVTGTSTTVTTTTASSTTQTETSSTATATTTTPVCNGRPDPIQCAPLIERQGLAICGNKIAVAPMDQRCPVSCGTCITTSSTTGTTTTTATTTTVTPTCNGKEDPARCSDVRPELCLDSNTGPLLSAACPVLCGTCLATPPPVDADCTNDPNCKKCNAATGSCERCQNLAFLHVGHCYESASDCSVRGLVPVGGQGGGKADSGYACVAYGGACTYESAQSCRPPKGLGDCLATEVNGPNEFKCITCHKDSWLVDGICRKQRICKNGRFMKGDIMTDEECSCKTVNADGTTNKHCKQCELRIAPPDSGDFFVETNKGEFRECGVCTNHMLKLEGQCVAPGTCPEGLAEVSWKETLGSCEAPFSCKGGYKFGGQNEGKRCRCLDQNVCAECQWGLDGHSCTICKKNTYLLEKSCISRDACIALGNYIPIQGDGPRGGSCIKLL